MRKYCIKADLYISTLRQVFSGHWMRDLKTLKKSHRPSFEKIVACFKSFSYHLEKSQALIRLDTTALHL
jgi:hypothetical protein